MDAENTTKTLNSDDTLESTDPVSAAVNHSHDEHDHAAHEHSEVREAYADEPRLRDMPVTLWHIPRILLLGLVRGYQATFSRTLPQNTCRFYPSCSHYGYQAIYKYGVIKGGLMAAWRVLRCNPFNPGGVDPVP